MLSMAKKETFFNSILIGYEKWVGFNNTDQGLHLRLCRLRPSSKIDLNTSQVHQIDHDVRLVEYARNSASRSTEQRRNG